MLTVNQPCTFLFSLFQSKGASKLRMQSCEYPVPAVLSWMDQYTNQNGLLFKHNNIGFVRVQPSYYHSHLLGEIVFLSL